MNTKRVLLTGSIHRHGSTLDYVKPRQETLLRCLKCKQWCSRGEMRIVNGVFKCVTCAGDVQDESEEE